MSLFRPAAMAALLLVCACKGSGGSEASGGKPDPVVAKVGDGAITVAELQARLEEQPPVLRSRYASLESKKEFLDNLVRFELLAQEARRQGLEQDPEVRDTLEKLIVQRLMKKHAATMAATPLPEEELRRYYQEHLAEYVRPEKVRVSQVFLASASNDSKRAAVKAEADKLLADVKRQEAGPVKLAFTELVRTRSDDAATKESAGDLGYLTREELAAKWGQAVADAAFGLQSLGDLGQVASERGLHLLKLTGRQPGMEQTFESVRPRIESRLQMERRARHMDELVSSLRSKTKVEVDEKALEGISVTSDGTGTVQPAHP
ncbi:peptidyl-prolyl cis-trans isomerase [Pyxidicoccus sp. 3LG]